MAWYYCEFCNQNVQISKKKRKAVCMNCGHFLVANSINQEEQQRRKSIRTGHCPKCDRDRYGIPLDVMRNDAILKIKNRKVIYILYFSLIWLIVFIAGLIGASPYSVETYNTIETYYTTLVILISFVGFWALISLFFNKKRGTIKKELEKVDRNVDNLKSKGYELLCSICLEPIVLKKHTEEG